MAATLDPGLRAKLAALPGGDRALLRTLLGLSLLALGGGVLMGAATALARAGWLVLDPEDGYRALTLHGVGAFFLWLYLAQAAFLLALAATGGPGRPALRLRWAGWLGGALMALGLGLGWTAPLVGTPLLYDATPEVAGEDRLAVALAAGGYLALALGLLPIAAAAIGTALAEKRSGAPRPWSPTTFGAVAWAGLVVVSAIAAVITFGPALLWALGVAPRPADHTAAWHLLFHNLHYLPLMGTVLLWYVLARDLCGVASVFGERFSKLILAAYLVLVPPTSLYHMFLEPGLAPGIRVLGSLLSLFISVPTVAVFLVIVVSLEAHARAAGARGLLGWLGWLPWREPAMAASGMAVVNLALGGAFSFVLIQERLAPLLGDTFFVPAYFHFLTVGCVTLTLLGAIAHVLPALTDRPLPAPSLLAALPYPLTLALALFGGAGVVAGLTGLPRRVLDASYAGLAPELWAWLADAVGLAAVVMAAAVLLYVLVLAAALVSPRGVTRGPARLGPPLLAAATGRVAGPAWTGPAAVGLLVLATYAATLAAFWIMQRLPLVAAGGAAH